MKNPKFSETQITRCLKEYECGKNVVDICQEMKISKNTFYLWKKKYSGMDADLLRKHKELERENSALKRMYADRSSNS
ncbi:MAG: transposase [Firmicutes bacterium]|nr:transposase [Bacillota bacterium]